MAIEFKLPELGENVEQGDLVHLLVSVGANVEEGQPVMELETDKAVVEVPSSVTGIVKEIRVKEGEKIKVGQTIFTLEDGNKEPRSVAPVREEKEEPVHAPAAVPDVPLREERAEIWREPAVAPSAPPKETRAPATSARGATEFKLPELAENVTQGDLVRLLISPGSAVSEGQLVLELETDKAVVEVPSDVEGIVKDIRVKEGQKVKVGQVIFTVAGEAAPVPPPEKPRPVEHLSGQQAARMAFQAAIQAEGKAEHEALPPDELRPAPAVFELPQQLLKTAGPEHHGPIPAAPHVRRLARELGVDIYDVQGAGPGGRRLDCRGCGTGAAREIRPWRPDPSQLRGRAFRASRRAPGRLGPARQPSPWPRRPDTGAAGAGAKRRD